jgi:hypothetical protein
MKTILTLSFWVTVILSVPTGIASAQDSTRVPEVSADANASVDATVHADVHAGTDEQSKQQPQPAGQANKRQQKGTIKWALQPSDQPPSTRFQTTPATKPALETDRSDSKALFNPLTRTEAPPEEESANGKKPSVGVPSAQANKPPGSKPQPDTPSAARLKLLESLNTNAAAPSSKTWNSSVNASSHKSTGTSATSATVTTRKKPKADAHPPLQNSLSNSSNAKSGSLKSNSEKRKSLDPTLHDKPGSALSSPN